MAVARSVSFAAGTRSASIVYGAGEVVLDPPDPPVEPPPFVPVPVPPFSARSLWNQPIEASHKQDNYWDWVAEWVADDVLATSLPYMGGNTVYHVPWDQPLVPMRMVGSDPDWATAIANPFPHLVNFGTDTWTVGVPMPFDGVPDTHDGTMGILKPRTAAVDAPVDYWELYATGHPIPPGFPPYSGNWYFVGGGRILDIQTHGGFWDHQAWPGVSLPHWGARAGGAAYIAGTMTIEELWSGEVPHMLSMLAPGLKHQWHSIPASREDSNAFSPTDQHAPMYGDRFYWDPAFDVDVQLASEAPMTRMIAKAAQTYGFTPVDQTGQQWSWIYQDPWPDYVTQGLGNPYLETVLGHPPIFRSSDTPNPGGSYTIVDQGAIGAGAWLGEANLRVSRRNIRWTGEATEP